MFAACVMCTAGHRSEMVEMHASQVNGALFEESLQRGRQTYSAAVHSPSTPPGNWKRHVVAGRAQVSEPGSRVG